MFTLGCGEQIWGYSPFHPSPGSFCLGIMGYILRRTLGALRFLFMVVYDHFANFMLCVMLEGACFQILYSDTSWVVFNGV